ncbi:Hpt domain-containing protein [Lewinella sp. LCG006]|uniref:Hpt domain-containing protein n=1 Tax=Lewinella sp. LCG006 TaxID=3231911 RepID=UPI0034605D8C
MTDLSFLQHFTKGDTAKMKRYINIYLTVAPKTFQQMQQAVRTQDWEQLRIQAHSLKPQTDYMGIHGLKAVLEDIEKNVLEEKFEKIHKLYEKALAIHSESTPLLKSFIDTP